MKKIRFILNFLGIIAILTAEACSLNSPKYKKEYTKTWKKIIQSDAWANSINKDQDDQVNLASADNQVHLVPYLETTPVILDAEKYHQLVVRAYFKIIAQAENAENTLRAEFDRWNEGYPETDNPNRNLKKEHALVIRRYKAHRAMLEGLKSWAIFSDFSTDDLEYFKMENKNSVLQMVQRGRDEEDIVNFLVYRLADLYHFE